MINMGIIGVGSYGSKRARTVMSSNRGNLVAISDTCTHTAEKASSTFNVPAISGEALIHYPHMDVVMICTPNNHHAPYIKNALTAGKHVFCEKPVARNLQEAKGIALISAKSEKTLKIGANHRFFKEVRQARKMVNNGEIGKLLTFTGRIGHDGERIHGGWQMNREISGGGTLLDNGWHMIDLARWFMGDFDQATGTTVNTFWKDSDTEDCATVVLTNERNQMATILSSYRSFSGYMEIELNGTDGFIIIDSRFPGRTVHPLIYQNRKESFEVIYADVHDDGLNSMEKELDAYLKDMEDNVAPEPSIEDAVETMRLIDLVYRRNVASM